MVFKERVSEYPNRRRLKPVQGYTDVYDIEREDGLEIVRQEGTPLTTKWLNEWTSHIDRTSADSNAKANTAKRNSETAQETANEAVKKSDNAVSNSLNAVRKAEDAVVQAASAVSQSDNALNQAQGAISVSNHANALSESVKSAAATAKSDAAVALSKANQIEEQAKAGAFNGKDAVMVETAGMFGLQIIGEDLWLCYQGESAPEMHINENGELIANI